MPVRQLNRRHFLLGTGGAVLSIPFLHSLQMGRARAQVPDQKFFVGFMTGHGGVWPEYMYPGDEVLTTSHSIYSDHPMQWGRLSATPSGDEVSLSRVLTCSSASMPQSLLDKMMVIRGLDIAFYVGHTTAATLGNYERRDQGPDTPDLYVPTIDQVLAGWSGFYGAGDPYTLKSMNVGDGMSWVERSSGVQAADPATSPDVLFRTVLSTVAPSEPLASGTPTQSSEQPAQSRTQVLNRVVEHFDRLTKGSFGDASRLSANDKARLNDHMDMVADLTRRHDAADNPGGGVAACDPQSGNTGNMDTSGDMYSPAYDDLRRWHQDYNAVFAAAIACGASRIATVRVGNTFHQSSNFAVDWEQWHQPIAHRAAWSRDRWAGSADLPEHPQDTLVTAKNNFYRDAFVDFINRLDAIDAGDGTALLDKGLVMWAHESGPFTHDNDSTPVVTAGSVDGYFNTGNYFDLHNRSASPFGGDSDGNTSLHAQRRPGILYNQWLSNVLQSMGMSPNDFQRNHQFGWAGYGHGQIDDSSQYPSRLKTDANNKIPKVTSGT